MNVSSRFSSKNDLNARAGARLPATGIIVRRRFYEGVGLIVEVPLRTNAL